MKSNIYIARTHAEKQAIDAIQKDKFDISIEENDMTDRVTRIFVNSDEMLDTVKELFVAANSFSYNPKLGVVIVDMSPSEAEDRLRRAFPPR